MFGLFRKKSRRPAALGKPIVVVSGLPRSGTSLAMKMLEAAGYEPVQDGLRQADEDNPRGYYEDERVKDLARSLDKSWLKSARGRVIKIISFLLKDLPRANQYRVIFMRRNLDEVLQSQAKMLDRLGEANATPDDEMRKMYEDHLLSVEKLIASHGTMSRIDIDYRSMVENPRAEAQRIGEFLGATLPIDEMVKVVDRNLYRNRA